jgi:hypothetical protein
MLERLTTIRIHAGIVRRAARKPEPLDKTAVIEHLDQIDRQVMQTAALVDGGSTAAGG